MSIQSSLEATNQNLLQKAIDLYYESKIDESLDILNQIQIINCLNNSDQALYKRYLLLNLMSQGNLKQARALRDEILDQYHVKIFDEKKQDSQEKVDIQEIILFICIFSYHEWFLFNVFQKEYTEQMLNELQYIFKQQNCNLSPLEDILFQLSESFYVILPKTNEEQFNYDMLIESVSGRLQEDCLIYVVSSFMRHSPFKNQLVNAEFEKCAHKLYEINPQHPLICYSLAIYYQNSDYQKAFHYFCQAFKLYNKNPVCNSFFLKFLTQYQKQQEFEYYYQQISSINLNHYRVALARAEYLASNNKQSDDIQVILNSLRLASDKTLIQYDYNYFHLEVNKFLNEDQLRLLYESAIKQGYDNCDFYNKLQNIYIESEEYEQLLQISFQYIKQSKERGEDISTSIYYQMENVYEYQNNIKAYVELQLSKNEYYQREFKYYNFKFDYQALDSLFLDQSTELIEFILKQVEEYEIEDNQSIYAQIDQEQQYYTNPQNKVFIISIIRLLTVKAYNKELNIQCQPKKIV
ncbi:hypothetical protein ABPG72_022182 [Tetrahymena utriculariae]